MSQDFAMSVLEHPGSCADSFESFWLGTESAGAAGAAIIRASGLSGAGPGASSAFSVGTEVSWAVLFPRPLPRTSLDSLPRNRPKKKEMCSRGPSHKGRGSIAGLAKWAQGSCRRKRLSGFDISAGAFCARAA